LAHDHTFIRIPERIHNSQGGNSFSCQITSIFPSF
jgi:hypothetical protein